MKLIEMYIMFLLGVLLGLALACAIVDDLDSFTVPFTNDIFVRQNK
jgi:hypothetical protein